MSHLAMSGAAVRSHVGGCPTRRSGVRMSVFRVTATDGAARAGVLTTAHGEVETPVFMPVGTKATVKTLMPARGARGRGADPARQHLPPAFPARRRADRRARRPAPVHGLGRADPDRLRRLPGVLAPRHDRPRRRRRRDVPQRLRRRRPTRFTPELAAAIQREPRAATSRCASTRCLRPASRGSSSRTPSAAPPSGRAASATPSARRRPAPLRDRPGRHRPRAPPALGSRSSSSSTSTATRSAASRSARTATLMFETTDWLAPLLPAGKPRYFMGIGDPEGILEVIEAGVDMFDCVLPTRTARTGSALTWEGRLNLRNAQFARDPRPARRELRLPRLHHVLAGLHPAPREPGGAARPPPALAPQSTLRPRSHPPARGRRSSKGPSARFKRDALDATEQPDGIPDRHRHPGRRRLVPAGACPRRRRQRAHAAMQDDIASRRRDHHRGRHARDRQGGRGATSSASRSHRASSSRSTAGPWRPSHEEISEQRDTINLTS